MQRQSGHGNKGDDVRTLRATATPKRRMRPYAQPQRDTGQGASTSHKLQEGGEEPVERTLQGTLHGAGNLLGRRLALRGRDGPHKVLHDEVLRRLRTDQHPARRAGVFWVRGRADHYCNLTLNVAFPLRRDVRVRKRGAVLPGDDLLWVVRGVLGQMVGICSTEPVLEAARAEGVST